MDVSIIIVNYNTLDITKNCIDSIYKSNTKVKFEIIVVDNGSTDGSKEYFSSLVEKYNNFKYIYNTANLGFSKANNLGIKNSVGDYLLLLNSDTIVLSDAIDKLLGFTCSRNNVGVVGPKLLNKDGSLQSSCFNFPTIRRAIDQYWRKKGEKLDKFAPKEVNPVVVDAVVGAAFLITPEARKKVGLLDEKYFFYYEDLDFCRRVSRSGLRTFYFPSSEVIHLHGKSGEILSKSDDQWKRLIPSSKLYHGVIKHYLFNFILWSGQKLSS